MKKIALLSYVIFLIYNSSPIIAEGQRQFRIDFKKVIVKEDWQNYVNLRSKGPYFFSESGFIAFDKNNQLVAYDVSTDKTRILIRNPPKQSLLLRVGGSLCLVSPDASYLIEDGMLKPASREFRLFHDLYFSFEDGVYERDDSNSKMLIPAEKYPYPFDRTFFTAPIVDDNGGALFYLSSYKTPMGKPTHKLIRYDLKAKASTVIREDVFFFSFLPKNPDLLLIFATGGTHGFLPGEFTGDFFVIDKRDGSVVQSFDESDYASKREFSITSFDVSSDDKIVAFGGFHDFSGSGKPMRYFSVLLLYIAEPTETKR